MRFIKATYLLLFILTGNLFSSVSLIAQERPYFENPIILNSQGADFKGRISSVVVDGEGFLWIGTTEGLYRYDGLQYIHFAHDPADSTSLISNQVRHLFYDQDKNQLWIGTWEVAKGLSILDLENYAFKNYYYNEQERGGITGASIFWSLKDKFGQYWVGTRGLSRYESEVDTFRAVRYSIQEEESFASGYKMISYSQDQFNDSLLWLGTNAGLLKFNVVTEQFEHFSIVKFSKNVYSLRSVYHHSDNQVYVGTWSSGLFRFDPVTEKFERIALQDEPIEKGLPIQRVLTIHPKNDQEIWIKTRAGLIEYNTAKKSVIRFKPNNPFKKQIYGVNYVDVEGRMYTWSYGKDTPARLFIYAPIRQQLRTYEKENIDIDRFNFIPHGVVQDEEDEDVLWITGQSTEGLYKLHLTSGKWTTYPPPANYFTRVNNSFQARDIIKIRSGELLVLTSNLIYVFSEDSKQLEPWRIQIPDKNFGFCRMIQDKNDMIWVGTFGYGLFKINPQNGTIKHYTKEELSDEHKLGAGLAYDLQEDRNGNIWVKGNGYSVYDRSRDTFFNFAYFFPEEKIVRHIEAVGLDAEGNAWISALSNGFLQAVGQTDADHPEQGVVRHFKMHEHFNTEKAFEFLLDKQGFTWLLSNSLERIRPDGSPVAYYSNAYLNGKEFTRGIALRDGRIAVGFRRGVGVFHPDQLEHSEKPIFPYVQSLSIFEQEIPLYEHADFDSPIILKPNENFIEFTLSVFNPDFFGEIEIQHQLIGVDESWVNTKDYHFASYPNLYYGDYTFEIRARKKGEEWSKNTYELPIRILTPWYLTNLAFLVYLVMLVGFIVGVYQFLLSKKMIKQESFRLKELDAFKTRFYANITHEFRTPLTVIRGMTDELYEKPKEKPRQKLALIRRNSQSLLDLINQMLSLSKLQAGGLKLNMRQQDIIKYLGYLVESYESYARSQGISLQFYSEEESLVMDMDVQKLERILLNLIANAIKFTPEHGKILIVTKCLKVAGEQQLRIMVKDNGVGITAKDIPHIFDLYRQGEGQQSHYGTGLGLALVKELVELMKGRVEVQSEPGTGTRFYIYLPIRKDAPKAKNDLYQKSAKLQKSKRSSEELTSNDSIKEDLDQPVLLLIEDNADVAFYIQNCLSASYHVVHQQDGKSGLEKSFELIPDIIISDVMMPEMDGFTVCKKLKTDERTNHIPIILLTAKATAEDKLIGLRYGADAYLTKPFDKQELLTRLAKLLEMRKILQGKYSATGNGDQRTLSASGETGSANNKKHPFLQKAEAIVLAQLDNENLSINELARHLHLSTSQVYRKIKALSGMSTAIFIRHVRLQQAKVMLADEALSISEIAYRSGFRSPVYFSQAFKETFGESPSTFQQRQES